MLCASLLLWQFCVRCVLSSLHIVHRFSPARPSGECKAAVWKCQLTTIVRFRQAAGKQSITRATQGIFLIKQVCLVTFSVPEGTSVFSGHTRTGELATTHCTRSAEIGTMFGITFRRCGFVGARACAPSFPVVGFSPLVLSTVRCAGTVSGKGTKSLGRDGSA